MKRRAQVATDRAVVLPDPTFPPSASAWMVLWGNSPTPIPPPFSVYIVWVGKTLGSRSECVTSASNGSIPLGTMINKGGWQETPQEPGRARPRDADKMFGKEAISFTRDARLVEGPLLLAYWPSCGNEFSRQESRAGAETQKMVILAQINTWIKPGLSSP